MVKIILLISFVVNCSTNGKSQVTPESLKGGYVGKYYFKYDSQPEWTISIDTVFVTNIDTNGCWVTYYGDISVCNACWFETNYSFCYVNSLNLFTRFYAEDSLWINYEHISMPPPNTNRFSKIFKGKKDGTLTGVNDMLDNLSFKSFPNPVRDRLYLSSISSDNNSTVNIYDLKGQLIFTKPVKPEEYPLEINVSNLSNGLYFILFLTSHKSFSSKFIKQ